MVEHELVPLTSDGQHIVTRVNKGHVVGGVRGGSQFILGDIGHPDADVVLRCRASR